MEDEEIPLYPVAATTIGPVPRLGLVVMRPDFLTHAMQTPEQAQRGRTYALSPAIARYVAEQLLSAVAKLESAAPPDGGGPTH